MMFYLPCSLTFLVLLSFQAANAIQNNYYKGTCRQAESIVRRTIKKHYEADQTIPASLLRLHFHDCFVQGCDGSILLDVSSDGSVVEKEGAPNKDSVRGFDVIEDVKARLESKCKGTVSCADIVALAARDSIVLLGGPYYQVPTGRLDGRISRKSEAEAKLPQATFTISQLKEYFANVGLSTTDLVRLSGGHTIGRARCSSFENRLYDFNNTGKPDPALNQTYMAELQTLCPHGKASKKFSSLDKGSEFKFDVSYYNNIIKGNGLLVSDNQLMFDRSTRRAMKMYAKSHFYFFYGFAKSMIKMGKIDLKSHRDGEIRLNCSFINPTPIEKNLFCDDQSYLTM